MILKTFLLAPLIIGALALVKTILNIKQKTTTLKELIWGISLSLIILSIIIFSFLIEGRVWIFTPVFRTYTYAILLPFIAYIISVFLQNKTENRSIKFISKALLISIAFTTLVCLTIQYSSFDYLDFLGVERTKQKF